MASKAEGISIQGFLYPGHVSAIIGEKPYEFIAQDHNIPGAVAGFEPVDVLMAVSSVNYNPDDYIYDLDEFIEEVKGK